MLKINHVLRSPDDEGGGGSAVIEPPAPTSAPAATSAPVATSAPRVGSTPAPTSAPAATPVPTAAPVKATWPEGWRETVSKGDAKRLSAMQRYASPEAVADALFAAQERIRSGELKPVLGAKATPEELKEWREAHGIPATPDKYELKDVKIDEADKPMLAEVFKAAHLSNQTPDQVAATVKAWNEIKQAAFEAQSTKDQALKTSTEDALRAEWGGEFRRNINLMNGLLDSVGAPGLADKFFGGRLSDGTPIGSSPEMLKLLVKLALVDNPTGVVVPGGSASTGEGMREELARLQKIPTSKKTQADSDRQLGLIDAAIKAGHMNEDGTWKKG